MKLTTVTLALSLLAILSACKKGDGPQAEAPLDARSKKVSPGFDEGNMVLYWNEKTVSLVQNSFTPQAQARFMAMVHIAVHDALNSIKPKYERYALAGTRDPFAAVDAAIASAAYHVIMQMGIQQSFAVQAWYDEALRTVPDGESKQKGIALGKAAAYALTARHTKEAYQKAILMLPIPEGTLPGQYRSTLPYSLPNMPKPRPLSQWSTLAPLVIESSTQFRVEPPYAVTSAEYAADYNEVKAKGGRAVHTRTPEEDEIGRFWVERSTSGWNRFARTLITNRKMDAWKTARLLALVNTAMADAGITNFESKYYYFYWRPETAIRLGDSDGNPATAGDPTWLNSYTEIPNPDNPALNVNTPPIPEYPSAHANFGGAAGEAMRLFFGSDQISVDLTSLTAPGITRHYTSLYAAIRDNSISRIYVGYHFRKAVDAGEEQGLQVANYVFNHAFREEGD